MVQGRHFAVNLDMAFTRSRGLSFSTLMVVTTLTLSGCGQSDDPSPPSKPVEAASDAKGPATDGPAVKLRPKAKIVDMRQRDEALSRAQVWRQPDVPIEQAQFGAVLNAPSEITCKFLVTELGGTTPKFDCSLEDGDMIRIKYGKGPEIPAEAAATRLLRAVGFGADNVTLAEKVRCYGCPKEPYSIMKAVELTQAERVYKNLMLDYGSFEEFSWVSVERRFAGRAIATDTVDGFNLFELDKIDATKGGAPRAHVDALRLMAVFIAHWDSKPDNQRLVCLSQDDWPDGQRCERPFALLQDVGATFGPHKVHLENWKKVKIWEDRATCRISMREMPYDGATFKPVQISEAGRQHLARLLTTLSDEQVMQLFAGARFEEPRGLMKRSSPIADWVSAFKAKVREVSEGAPCPVSST